MWIRRLLPERASLWRKNAGDEVISATINKNGSFRFRASRVGDDTTLAQIIRLWARREIPRLLSHRLADRV